MSATLAALLARRLCHDFAGATGAIATALEMLDENPDPELIALGIDSAKALTSALELYRYVLTPSAADAGTGQARALIEAWLAARGGPGLEWTADDAAWGPGHAQLVAGLAMVVAEATPHHAAINVAGSAVAAPGAALGPDIIAALHGDPATTTRAALAAAVAAQAAAAGLAIGITADPLCLTARQSGR